MSSEPYRLCAFCPKLCRFACPVSQAEHRETVTPWGKMSAGYLVGRGAAPLDREWAELYYRCVECLHCRHHCDHEKDVPASLRLGRQRAFLAGVAPEAIGRLIEGFQGRLTPLDGQADKMVAALCPPDLLIPEAPVALFVGCTTLKDGHGELQGALQVLKALKLDFVGVHGGSAQCCGYPLLAAGDHDGFLRVARAVAEQLRGRKEVVSLCPACVVTLRDYANHGVELGGVRVRPLVELVRDHIPSITRPGLGRRVAYHDPCFLARHLGVTEPPRQLLTAILGAPPIELSWNRQDTACCGGGGLLPLTAPQTALTIAQERLRDLDRLGVSEVVTDCPGCIRSFKKAASPGLRVSSLWGLMAEWLER